MIEQAGTHARGRDADNMTREHKLALILGFSVVLVVGVLISDHFSGAAVSELDDLSAPAGITTNGTMPDQRSGSRPIERTHASAPVQSPQGDRIIPGGFSIDGERDTEPAMAGRPAFETSRDALLAEIQRSWNMAQEATPAAELDRSSETPAERTELFSPVVITQGPGARTLAGQNSGAIPEPTSVTASRAIGDPGSGGDTPTRSHRVTEDESLWSIAEGHYGDGALYARLAAFNSDRVGEDNSIRVGVVLRIPPRGALTGEKPAPRRATSGPSTGNDLRTYTVAEGDTLGEIAQRLLGSSRRWTEIVTLNGIDDPDAIPVGTTLRLPAPR
jgi:nucleoid-associated protein YgaU